jgi:hypothetical protein
VTFAPEAQINPQSKLKLTLCLALTHTYILILIYALILTQTRAYTPNYSESKCRWGASVPGATVVLPCFIHRRGGGAIFRRLTSPSPPKIGFRPPMEKFFALPEEKNLDKTPFRIQVEL